jgi:superfamily II DNA/RNA helicase
MTGRCWAQVLDEADRLLDAGFGSEMGAILSAVSSERQVSPRTCRLKQNCYLGLT